MDKNIKVRIDKLLNSFIHDQDLIEEFEEDCQILLNRKSRNNDQEMYSVDQEMYYVFSELVENLKEKRKNTIKTIEILIKE